MIKKTLKFIGYGILGLILLGVVVGIFSGGEDTADQDVNNEADATEEAATDTETTESSTRETDTSEETESTEDETEEPKEEKSQAEATDLGSGTFYVGEDINPGRYVVSTEESSGNFFIKNDDSFDMGTNEVLGTNDISVNNITVELKEGDEIEISGLNNVHFGPKEASESVSSEPEPTDLGSGTFIVGEDIAAGRYVVSTDEPSGNFFINTQDTFDMGTNEVLGTNSDLAVNDLTVELKDGDEIEIKGLNNVHFEPK